MSNLLLLGAGTIGAAVEFLPIAPSSLSATAISDVRIDLAWTDNSADETGFSIERKTTGAFAEIDTAAADATTYSDTGLTAETEYTYRVRAYRGALYSEYSNEDAATTEAAATSQTSAFFDFSQATSWTNASNMGADDSSYATKVIGPTESQDLTLLDCQGFTLPDGATITGFTLLIKFKTDGVNGPIDPSGVLTTIYPHLVLGGLDVGGVGTGTVGTWGEYNGTSDTTQVTASFTASVTAAQIKQPDFGVFISPLNVSEGGDCLASVNFMSLTVDYLA